MPSGIRYEPFEKEAFTLTFHPYYLKQYNNRWFVFGRNEELGHDQWSLTLDRILALDIIKFKYQSNETDWEDFFYDVIGISKSIDSLMEHVELLCTPSQAPYIKTKPIHPSQRTEIKPEGSLLVKLNVVVNYELETKVLGHADKVKVLAPDSLKERIATRLKEAKEQY